MYSKTYKYTKISVQLTVFGYFIKSCNEMVMPMCSDGINDMFEAIPWNYTAYTENCLKQFGLRPRLDMAKIVYGGRSIRASSNIVFR